MQLEILLPLQSHEFSVFSEINISVDNKRAVILLCS